MATCLMQPVTTFFFVSQMKKTCPKQPPKTLSSKEMGTKHKEQSKKNKCLFDYIYFITTL